MPAQWRTIEHLVDHDLEHAARLILLDIVDSYVEAHAAGDGIDGAQTLLDALIRHTEHLFDVAINITDLDELLAAVVGIGLTRQDHEE